MASSTSDLDKYPIASPPPGVIPNYERPETRTSAIYITAGICIPLILFFALLRLYAKLRITKLFKWDDLACALGVAASITYIIVTVVACVGGNYGKHQWEILAGELTKQQLLLSLASQAIYGPIIWFIKLSIFVLLVEIFYRIRWLKYMAITGAVLTGLFYISVSIAFMALCAPTSGTSQSNYLSALSSAKCATTKPLTVAIGVVNVCSDTYLILLPLPAVWSLNLPFKKKLAVSSVFATGLVACIASVLGLYYRVVLVTSTDDSWNVIPTWVTTLIEMTAGTMVSCMPTTAAVFRQWKAPVSSFMSSSKRRLWSAGGSRSTRDEKTTSETDLKPLSRPSTHTVDGERYSDRHARGSEEPFPLSHQDPYTHSQPIFGGRTGGIRKTTEVNMSDAPVRHQHVELKSWYTPSPG